MLERLGFLRRVSKCSVVYQVKEATTRMLVWDSSIRRRHTREGSGATVGKSSKFQTIADATFCL